MAKKTTTAASPVCTSNPLASLRSNPIFHLSLSSKELFHSNFLVWLADYQTALFNEILEHCFDCKTFEYAPDRYVALREYKNFDFCICERDAAQVDGIGRIVFLLENKFKSIPYKAQLDEYVQKAAEYNFECWKVSFKGSKGIKRLTKKLIQDHYNDPINECTFEQWDNYIKDKSTKPPYNPHFVLLTLAKKFLDKKDIEDEGIWKIVTYREYARAIKAHCNANNVIKDDSNTCPSLEEQIVNKYAEFIGDLCSYLKGTLPINLACENWSIIDAPTCLKDLRIGDIWEKLIANLIVLELKKKLGSPNVELNKSAKELFGTKVSVGTISLLAGFSHGTAVVDVKYKQSNDLIYGIQIQNGQYRQYVEFANKSLTSSTVLKTRIHANVFGSFSGKSCKFGDTFLYKYEEIPNGTTVKEVLKEIIDDIKTFP